MTALCSNCSAILLIYVYYNLARVFQHNLCQSVGSAIFFLHVFSPKRSVECPYLCLSVKCLTGYLR